MNSKELNNYGKMLVTEAYIETGSKVRKYKDGLVIDGQFYRVFCKRFNKVSGQYVTGVNLQRLEDNKEGQMLCFVDPVSMCFYEALFDNLMEIKDVCGYTYPHQVETSQGVIVYWHQNQFKRTLSVPSNRKTEFLEISIKNRTPKGQADLFV